MMRQISVTLGIVLFVLSGYCMASGYDITNKDYSWEAEDYYRRPALDKELTEMLYGKYPFVGADEASAYYIDPTSCDYKIHDGIATLVCLVYNTGGGANPDGSPAKVNMTTYEFDTYKANEIRQISLKSVVKTRTGENITQRTLKYDNGFLKALFWRTAKYSNLSRYLD